RHGPAGGRRAAGGDLAAVTDSASATESGATPIRIRVRLFAMQRELAGTREVVLELPIGATIEDAWRGLVAKHPLLAPGRSSVRFARNAAYAPATTLLEDGDEVAMIPPVSGGSQPPAELPILELREVPFTKSILGDLADRLAVPADGAIVGFLGITRSSPGTPAPGQESAAARHAGRSVSSLEYEAHPVMTLRILGAIAGEIAERFGVERLAIVHRTGQVPLGEASVAVVACAPHRDAAFDAARYAIDQTKARAPIWKAEHFTDGKVWIGTPAIEGPESAEPG
ncbi:MAG TPA: molybdenum cofactor biosynthesis protein MoaE, partial [Candidatus Limnocylindrales bacterium]|nr:molybdenum cofactor biosynthesis protein MoaE [Candidatus Limnocylindrales bacterium]